MAGEGASDIPVVDGAGKSTEQCADLTLPRIGIARRRGNRKNSRRRARAIVAWEVVRSVVLVAGSSSGIGLATAIHFARLGWEVYAGLRDLATATELHRVIETDKLPIRPLALDVNDDGSVARGVGEVLRRSAGLRIRVVVIKPGVVVTPIFTKAKRLADPASPYAVHVKDSRLRYLVGDDARRLTAGRRRLTTRSISRPGVRCPTRSTSTSCASATGSSGRAGPPKVLRLSLLAGS